MALSTDERLVAYAAARRYIDQHDVGIQLSEPMLNGILDAAIAALEPVWAADQPKHKAPPKHKAEDDD